MDGQHEVALVDAVAEHLVDAAGATLALPSVLRRFEHSLLRLPRVMHVLEAHLTSCANHEASYVEKLSLNPHQFSSRYEVPSLLYCYLIILIITLINSLVKKSRFKKQKLNSYVTQ